jgi:hypothetical protein
VNNEINEFINMQGEKKYAEIVILPRVESDHTFPGEGDYRMRSGIFSRIGC